MFRNEQLIQETPKLKKFALRLTRNVHDAEDLLQSTILRAMEKKHLFQTDTDLFKWTSKMMYNLFVSDYRRKVKFETQYNPEDYLDNQAESAPQDTQVELMKVNEAMSLLSGEHREILVMVCVQGMRYQDVAKALDIPVGTVRSRLSRARMQLQHLLDSWQSRSAFVPPPVNNQLSTDQKAAA